tara:strand:- start:332 stop:1057 length:726 start_codon:yes stop_codon:yes gene_type:complete
MLRNQSNKLFLELMVKSGVSFFTKNQPNNYYILQKKIETESELSNNLQLEDIATIEELTNYINRSDKCLLKNSAKKTVIADGNPASKLMIIGEAPGKDEDEQGIPFVGQAGQLLNKMLTAINIQRKDVYITNVIPWRPPNNRPPTNEEILMCLPFLQKHIELIKPKFLLLLGATAAKSILSSPLSISKLRNKWHEYSSMNLNLKIKTLVSYHPAFLLRSPQFKKEAWEDLQNLQQLMNQSK